MLTAVLQTAVLLQIEIGIGVEEVFETVPKLLKPDEMMQQKPIDTSLDSKLLLCPIHIGKLISVVKDLERRRQ